MQETGLWHCAVRHLTSLIGCRIRLEISSSSRCFPRGRNGGLLIPGAHRCFIHLFSGGFASTAVPVVEKELIQDLLFEMGVGMHWLPSELEDSAALDGMDMILAMEDAEVGVPHEMLGWLEYLYFDRQLPVYLLGSHLLSATSGLTSEERQRWEHLVHLQGQGVEGVHQQVVLEERGFFQSFLQGRFGQVSPFVVSGEMDQASATSNAEAIVRLDETDLMVRYPAGGMVEAAQPRWVSQNFPFPVRWGRKRTPSEGLCSRMPSAGCCSVALVP